MRCLTRRPRRPVSVDPISAGEGCFLPEAYLPENRRQRFMGELPHQWVEIHEGCECGAWVEHWIKSATASASRPVPSPLGTSLGSSMVRGASMGSEACFPSGR
jgi:hypothetical protein